MYITYAILCLFSALSRGLAALQISIIISIIIIIIITKAGQGRPQTDGAGVAAPLSPEMSEESTVAMSVVVGRKMTTRFRARWRGLVAPLQFHVQTVSPASFFVKQILSY